MAIDHADAVGIHRAAFVGATDPALDMNNKVTAGKLWIDTSDFTIALKMRNAANTGWDVVIPPYVVSRESFLGELNNVTTDGFGIVRETDASGARIITSVDIDYLISAGANITKTFNAATGKLTLAAAGGAAGITLEDVDDRVNALILAGANITKTYDDVANTLTLAAASGGSGLTLEDVDDRVAALIIAGANITKTYDDEAGTLTLAAPPSTGGGATVFSGARIYTTSAAIPNSSTGGSDLNLQTAHQFFDVGSYFNSSQPTRVTVPTAGYYSVTAQLAFPPNGSGFRSLRIRRGEDSQGDGSRDLATDKRLAISSDLTTLTATATAYLTAGASLILNAYQNSGSNLSPQSSASFICVHKIA